MACAWIPGYKKRTLNLNSENTIMASYTGTVGNDTINGTPENDVIDGLAGDDRLYGREGNDSISGDAGDDQLDGGPGNDTLDGGDGSDWVYYLEASGAVTVNLALGTASGADAGSDTLISVENVSGSAYGDTLIGSAASDNLYGEAGNDSLDGGAGDDNLYGGNDNDTLSGGAGSDYFQFRSTAADTSTDTITDFQAGLGGDWLSIPTWLFSNYTSGADPFASGHTRLTQSGANTLVEIDVDGAAGVAGFETIAILNNVNKTSLVASNLGGFEPPLSAGATDGADSLTGTSGNDYINSGAGNDTLSGLAGDDTLDGGTGSDSLTGGTGNDLFVVDTTGDKVIENVSEGTDTVWASVGYSLPDNVENLTLTGTADYGVGNSLANVITGNGQANVLIGWAGNDTLDGGAGTDTAQFGGNLANFTLTRSASTYSVHDKVGTDGTDSVSNVELLQFSDMTVNLTIQAKAAAASLANVNSLVELYVAYFNRVPDANGLAYWIDQLGAGSTLNQIAESFYSAGVTFSTQTGFSEGMSNQDFINVFYQNVLGRPAGADAAGLAYWNGKLAEGSSTRSSLGLDIVFAAHTYKGDATWGWVADLLDNKITVAKTFAIDWGLNYNTEADNITNGVAIAAAVTPTSTAAAITLIGLASSDMNLG